MIKINKFLFSVAVICSTIVLFIYSTKEPTKNTGDSYQIKALKIPNNLNFAGEKIPLHKSDIRERIDKELLINTYWQSNALLLIKRANKYFPIIEPILEKYSIPNDFKYLAVIESGLENVTSAAGAKGFWQLMPHTAKERGLEVNSNIDERYHIEKATEAACSYLLHSKDLFGTWTLAAAAYNAGNRGISRNLEKQQVENYYDLLLSTETQRYLPRIIAIKEILSHANYYGFTYENEDLYILEESTKIKVDTAINNIALFAKKMNCNYKELKLHNPWLRENKLNNKSQKNYILKIPK
jgi:membrane-bound lytic murein transglycosylase D